MTLEHWNETADGPLTEQNFRRKLCARGYTCAVYLYPPGTCFPDHRHLADKIDGVLRGRFRITMLGKSHVLGAGDCVYVPRGTVHNAEVIGDETVVSIDAVRS